MGFVEFLAGCIVFLRLVLASGVGVVVVVAGASGEVGVIAMRTVLFTTFSSSVTQESSLNSGRKRMKLDCVSLPLPGVVVAGAER